MTNLTSKFCYYVAVTAMFNCNCLFKFYVEAMPTPGAHHEIQEESESMSQSFTNGVETSMEDSHRISEDRSVAEPGSSTDDTNQHYAVETHITRDIDGETGLSKVHRMRAKENNKERVEQHINTDEDMNTREVFLSPENGGAFEKRYLNVESNESDTSRTNGDRIEIHQLLDSIPDWIDSLRQYVPSPKNGRGSPTSNKKLSLSTNSNTVPDVMPSSKFRYKKGSNPIKFDNSMDDSPTNSKKKALESSASFRKQVKIDKFMHDREEHQVLSRRLPMVIENGGESMTIPASTWNRQMNLANKYGPKVYKWIN